LLDLCERVHRNSGAEVVLANFRLPAHFDPGPLRHRSLGSDYAFRKFVNLHVGLDSPNYVHICDIEFLSNRTGNLAGLDDRSWFESKQPYAADLMVHVARELGVVLCHLKSGPKKLLVLDLDNTLWGGVIGDDGLEGIEIGTTSPRGEAFRAFQKSLLSLKERGILLAVCSKNDYERAIEPFERHPEMILRMKDIVCFKANWEPKSDNIREIAQEMNLGLDSFVFVDDNPAEIEIVRQFLPQVSGICLGDDPSEFVGKLKDSRFFEMRSVTSEDVERADLYKQETERQVLLSKSTDMNSYLESLAMQGFLSEFVPADVPRVTQLINKSNQFNLTTRRRTESEVQAAMQNQDFVTLTMRLSDKFGEHGLISIVIGKVSGKDMEMDTWLMSCRVLKRQVEEEVLNEVVRLAERKGCERLVGTYIPTEKNSMVRDLYPRLGFERDGGDGDNLRFTLSVADYRPKDTKIAISSRVYGSVAGYSRVAEGI
jgi:FkbH-like protein